MTDFKKSQNFILIFIRRLNFFVYSFLNWSQFFFFFLGTCFRVIFGTMHLSSTAPAIASCFKTMGRTCPWLSWLYAFLSVSFFQHGWKKLPFQQVCWWFFHRAVCVRMELSYHSSTHKNKGMNDYSNQQKTPVAHLCLALFSREKSKLNAVWLSHL